MQRRLFGQVIVLACIALVAQIAAGSPTLLITEYDLNRVDEYTPSGTFLRTFISGGSGGLTGPNNLRFGPDGSLYVGGDGAVKRYDGTTGAYLGNAAAVGKAYDVLPDAAGYLYVTYDSTRVNKYSSDGTPVASYTDRISSPHGLAFMPNGHLLVTNSEGAFGNTLTELDPATGIGTTFATGLNVPIAVVAGPDGRYYVSNYGDTIQVVPASGGVSSTFNIGGNLPSAAYLAFLGGNLYAASSNTVASTVQIYDGTTGAAIGSFTPAGQALGIAVIPEPASALLLLAGAPLILRRRCRR